jgi:hypothetical protein
MPETGDVKVQDGYLCKCPQRLCGVFVQGREQPSGHVTGSIGCKENRGPTIRRRQVKYHLADCVARRIEDPKSIGKQFAIL